MTKSSHAEYASCGHVDVLTTSDSGDVLGYKLIGQAPGPQLTVIGACASADQAFDRLLSIPTLPWMRGNLVLIRADTLEHIVTDLASIAQVGPVDRTMILPWSNHQPAEPLLIKRYYREVLRSCAHLGMISGRGIYEPMSKEDIS